VPIKFFIADSVDERVDVAMELSSGTPPTAAETSDGADLSSPYSMSNLAYSSVGAQYSFLSNAAADLGAGFKGSTEVQLTPFRAGVQTGPAVNPTLRADWALGSMRRHERFSLSPSRVPGFTRWRG
jgi:hypothetical protein